MDLKALVDRLGAERGQSASFDRWRKQFLELHESFLSQQGIEEASDAYKKLCTYGEKFATTLIHVQRLVDKDIFLNKGESHVSVKGQNALHQLNTIMTEVVQNLHDMVPSNTTEERTCGYNKYQLGAALVEDNFSAYSYLLHCCQISTRMRQSCLEDVADKQILEMIEYYELNLKRFCDLMADLGLYRWMVVQAAEAGKPLASPPKSRRKANIPRRTNNTAIERSSSPTKSRIKSPPSSPLVKVQSPTSPPEKSKIIDAVKTKKIPKVPISPRKTKKETIPTQSNGKKVRNGNSKPKATRSLQSQDSEPIKPDKEKEEEEKAKEREEYYDMDRDDMTPEERRRGGKGPAEFVVFVDIKTGAVGKFPRGLCVERGLLTIVKGNRGNEIIVEATKGEPERKELMNMALQSATKQK